MLIALIWPIMSIMSQTLHHLPWMPHRFLHNKSTNSKISLDPYCKIYECELLHFYIDITFTQIQDSKHGTAPCLPQVVVGNAGVEASITGFAVPNPEATIFLVLHVQEVIIVIPVQGGLGVSNHSHLQTDVTACSYSSVPHFARKNGWRRGGVTRCSRVRDSRLEVPSGPFRGYDGARGRCRLICPFLQSLLHLSFSHG